MHVLTEKECATVSGGKGGTGAPPPGTVYSPAPGPSGPAKKTPPKKKKH